MNITIVRSNVCILVSGSGKTFVFTRYIENVIRVEIYLVIFVIF